MGNLMAAGAEKLPANAHVSVRTRPLPPSATRFPQPGARSAVAGTKIEIDVERPKGRLTTDVFVMRRGRVVGMLTFFYFSSPPLRALEKRLTNLFATRMRSS